MSNVVDIVFLKMDDVININKVLVIDSGGIFGIRDFNLLDSCLNSPRNQCCYNNEKDLLKLATVYCYSIIYDHPFIDGNKRTAISFMFLFLLLNSKNEYDYRKFLSYDKNKLYDYTIKLAEKKITKEDFYNFLVSN